MEPKQHPVHRYRCSVSWVLMFRTGLHRFWVYTVKRQGFCDVGLGLSCNGKPTNDYKAEGGRVLRLNLHMATVPQFPERPDLLCCFVQFSSWPVLKVFLASNGLQSPHIPRVPKGPSASERKGCAGAKSADSGTRRVMLMCGVSPGIVTKRAFRGAGLSTESPKNRSFLG